MYIDAEELFSDGQVITGSAASENQVDIGSDDRDIGVGETIYLVVQVSVAFTDAGDDSTVAVTLETDDNDGFSSPTVLQTLGTFGALSAVGAQFIQQLQPSDLWERFLRLNYVVANGDLDTGALDSFFTLSIDRNRLYPDNSQITN